MSPLPTIFAKDGWYTTHFIAYRLNRPLRTIQHWCRIGFFGRRGCIVVGTTGGSGNYLRGSRYWIYIPTDSKDAILRNIELDILCLAPLPYQGEGII